MNLIKLSLNIYPLTNKRVKYGISFLTIGEIQGIYGITSWLLGNTVPRTTKAQSMSEIGRSRSMTRG